MTTTAAPVLSLPDAERLVERTLERVTYYATQVYSEANWAWDAIVEHRERLASDLAGLRACMKFSDGTVAAVGYQDHAQRYSDSLRRTAALYGVA